jgi:hypothetical protein
MRSIRTMLYADGPHLICFRFLGLCSGLVKDATGLLPSMLYRSLYSLLSTLRYKFPTRFGCCGFTVASARPTPLHCRCHPSWHFHPAVPHPTLACRRHHLRSASAPATPCRAPLSAAPRPGKRNWPLPGRASILCRWLAGPDRSPLCSASHGRRAKNACCKHMFQCCKCFVSVLQK